MTYLTKLVHRAAEAGVVSASIALIAAAVASYAATHADIFGVFIVLQAAAAAILLVPSALEGTMNHEPLSITNEIRHQASHV